MKDERKKEEAEATYEQSLKNKNDVLLEEFTKKWNKYSKNLRLHDIDTQEYKLERMGHELETAIEEKEWKKWPCV